MSEKARDWIEYAKERPETAGAYEWRVPSAALKEAQVMLRNMGGVK